MRLYPILVRLLRPLALAWMRSRRGVAEGWAATVAERQGALPARRDRPLWLHAASVGEVHAALPLLRALHERWPGLPVQLSAFTPTGLARWRALYPDIASAALPLDHPDSVARALDALRPRVLLIVETELWPNLLRAAHARQIPVLFVSARVRESSLRGWRRWVGPKLLAEALAPVRWLGAQTAADAARFASLGATRVAVAGNLKWDARPPVDAALQAEFAAALQARSAWLAASTHPGEDEILLAAHAALLKQDPACLLLLAPRHPRRAEEVAALCAQAGLRVARRSRGESPAAAQVWLIDTLGELTALMAACPRVFLGGSLVPVGGHNLLEPAALDCALAVGPHTDNAAEVAAALEQAGGLQRVADAAALAALLQQWFSQPAQAAASAAAARACLEAGGGAVQAALAQLAPLLETPAGPDGPGRAAD